MGRAVAFKIDRAYVVTFLVAFTLLAAIVMWRKWRR